MGAERAGADKLELALRRLTAAAYGFTSWSDFRAWRKRNPVAYRERSRQLLEPAEPDEEPGIVVDLFA